MNIHQRQREREKAKEFWECLSPSERWGLGDQLVLGSFDWMDWGFTKRPSGAFLDEVDYLRMLWECEG
jgi:hypothetical protein